MRKFFTAFIFSTCLSCTNNTDSSAISEPVTDALRQQVAVIQTRVDSLISALAEKQPAEQRKTKSTKQKNSFGRGKVAQQTQPATLSAYNWQPTGSTTPTYQKLKEEKQYAIRTGAICRDGTTSSATGRGACSHHGGVSQWLYE